LHTPYTGSMRRAVLVVVIAMVCSSATAMSRSVRPVNIWQIWFQNIRPVVMAPGEQYQFSLGTWFSWFQFVPATAAEVAWTVEPPFGHATISADGTLSVDTSAESLTTYTVY